jgi:hypothetical protein
VSGPTFFRPYELRPGWPITFEVRCADGSAAIVTGVIDKVPHLAGNIAQRVVVRDATARPVTPDVAA